MSWDYNHDKTPEENSRMFLEAAKRAEEDGAKFIYETAIRNGASEEEAHKAAANVKVSL